MMDSHNTPKDAPPLSHLQGQDETLCLLQRPVHASWIDLAQDFLQGYTDSQDNDVELQVLNVLPSCDDVTVREYQLSAQSHMIPTEEDQGTKITPRRTQLHSGWYENITSTGSCKLNQQCEDQHQHISITSIRSRLQALNDEQSKIESRSLRLSDDHLKFSIHSIPEVAILLYLPLYLFIARQKPTRIVSYVKLFKFFCYMLSHPNENLKDSITADSASFLLTDTLNDVTDRFAQKHKIQLSKLESFMLNSHPLFKPPPSVHNLISILKFFLRLRELATYECYLAINLASFEAKQSCSRLIFTSCERESRRMSIYRTLYRIREDAQMYFAKNIVDFQSVIHVFSQLTSVRQLDCATDKLLIPNEKMSLVPDYLSTLKRFSTSSIMCNDHPRKPDSTRIFAECTRLLAQLPLCAPSKIHKLTHYRDTLDRLYTIVQASDRTDAHMAIAFKRTLITRCSEDLQMHLWYLAKRRYATIKDFRRIAFFDLHDVIVNMIAVADRQIDKLCSAKKQKVIHKTDQFCVFCQKIAHIPEFCDSTIHPVMKRQILESQNHCFRCLQKILPDHLCMNFCALCYELDHHSQICLERVPPLVIKKVSFASQSPVSM